MNTKRISILYLLLTCLFLSACGSGQAPGNVNTPIPTGRSTVAKPTNIPTFTPVPTFTPIPPTPTLNKGIQDPESGHWYLTLEQMGWDEAKEYCSALGGHLAIIDNASEDHFVYNSVYIPGNNPGLQLGATDRDHEGRWVWVTGEEMQYTNWAEGEPNNCGNLETLGKCTPENDLTYVPDHSGQWYDVPSDKEANYLCEFEN